MFQILYWIIFILYWIQFWLYISERKHYNKMFKAFVEITTFHGVTKFIPGFEPECLCGKNLKDCATYGAISNWAAEA